MNRLRVSLPLLLFVLTLLPYAARAQESKYSLAGPGYPFLGVDLGVSEPTNDNYRAHVQTGGTGNPFVGYMFNNLLGIQGQVNFAFQEPDNDHRGFAHENETSTLLGFTAGPRLALPLGDLMELYGTGQGGYFTGLSGRLNHSAPGFSVGGGLDFNVTRNLSVGLFGRWNRAYMAPHCQGGACGVGSSGPADIGPTQVASERSREDIQWATAGVGLKWSFKEAPKPPPPPPPVAKAPPPPPPAKQKIVLRSVHFDFDKSNIRADARPVLDEAASILKEQGSIDVVVAGHTDNRGADAYNMKLSHRRADAVKKYLIDHGIAASRIRTTGFGESKPVASNDTNDGRAQNRRVELNID